MIAADFNLVWRANRSFRAFPGIGPFGRSIKKNLSKIQVILAFCVILPAY
jgi:hypothetical protein